MTCPKCSGEMSQQHRAGVAVAQCEQCEGIFLDHADRGDLAEQENDWHNSRGPATQPLPRITSDMQPPPPGQATGQHYRSFLDSLFG